MSEEAVPQQVTAEQEARAGAEPPPEARERHAGRLIGIPMPTGKVRSLNLATAAGIVLYEALRQLHEW